MELNQQGWKLERTPEEAENAMIQMFAQLYSKTINAFVDQYGPSAYDIARSSFMDTMVSPIREGAVPFENRGLDTFIQWLVSGICVGHRGEFVEKTEKSVKFNFTACPYATIFRQLGMEKIGKFFCEADGPLLEAFNSELKFERTRTLMDGDDCCDHHYTAQ